MSSTNPKGSNRLALRKIHLQEPLGPDERRWLETACRTDPAITEGPEPPPDAAYDTLVAGVPTEALLDGSDRLARVVIPWAGLPSTTAARLAARPHLRVYNVHHNAAATAEMAVGLVIAAAKRLVPHDAALRAGDWRSRSARDQAISLRDRDAVVLGHGAIGSRVAPALAALGMRVTALRRGSASHRAAAPDDARDRADDDARSPAIAVRDTRDWPDPLDGATVLVVCVPFTRETEGLVDAAALTRLAPDAVVVNVARGPIVDEDALYEALRTDRIFGAGLDVWYRYPREDVTERVFPSRHAFHELPNVVLSPHRAGHVRETERLRVEALAALFDAISAGRPPREVKVERGY